MDGVIASVPWDGISGWGIVLLVLVAFLTGRLKTRRDYEDQVRRADKADEQARYWQGVAEQRSSQVDTLLPSLDTVTKFMEAIVRRTGPDSDGDS